MGLKVLDVCARDSFFFFLLWKRMKEGDEGVGNMSTILFRYTVYIHAEISVSRRLKTTIAKCPPPPQSRIVMTLRKMIRDTVLSFSVRQRKVEIGDKGGEERSHVP